MDVVFASSACGTPRIRIDASNTIIGTCWAYACRFWLPQIVLAKCCGTARLMSGVLGDLWRALLVLLCPGRLVAGVSLDLYSTPGSLGCGWVSGCGELGFHLVYLSLPPSMILSVKCSPLWPVVWARRQSSVAAGRSRAGMFLPGGM